MYQRGSDNTETVKKIIIKNPSIQIKDPELKTDGINHRMNNLYVMIPKAKFTK